MITGKIKIILLLAAVITVLGTTSYIKSIKAECATLKRAVALAQFETEGLRIELNANKKSLMQREQQRALLAAETEVLNHEFEELYKNNQGCAAWANAALPDSVRKRLQP